MLPASNRLRHRRDFAQFRASRSSFVVEGIRFRWMFGRTGAVRAGVIVSKRVDKRATRRNRIRRVIREALRPMLSTFPPGTQILATALAPSPKLTAPVLRRQLTSACTRARLIKA
ncbi:MAG: ribonuclease P protein component [Patescibacteria group bacterium]